MKTLLLSLALIATILVSGIAITGCGTTAQQVAYKSAGTTEITVETALRAYNQMAKAGKTTIKENQQVKAAYEKYQNSFALLCDAGAVYAATGGTNATASAVMQQAVSNSAASIADLLALIQSFGTE